MIRSTMFVTAAASAIWMTQMDDATVTTNVSSHYYTCECRGYANENRNETAEEDDPTIHNFDGDDCVEPLEDTDVSQQDQRTPWSIFPPSSIFVTSNKDKKQSSNVLDQDIQKVIQTISADISSSFNPENVAMQLKELMDQIVIPPRNTTTTSSSVPKQEDSFQQIILCLFNIVMNTANETETTASENDDVEKDTSIKCKIKANITQAVSDLLAAIQKSHVITDQQNSKTSTSSSSNRNSSSSNEGSADIHAILPPSAIEDTTTIFDLCQLLMSYSKEIHQLVTKHMSNIDYQRITPTAIAYYADYANTKYESLLQERLKQSGSRSHNIFLMQLRSWQQQQQEQFVEFFNRHHQQQHRDDDDVNQANNATEPHAITNTVTKSKTAPTIDPSILHIIETNPDAIALAELAYADTMEAFRDGLHNLPSRGRYQYELIHCDLKSEPGKPAHYYLIRRPLSDTTPTTNPELGKRYGSMMTTTTTTTLDVVIVIRGTKTVADAITDLLCDIEPYHRWGKAHSYILDSGRYIANRYRSIFENLLKTKEVSKINVTIYGHSLGAGAGAIAAMELHNLQDRRIQVQMIGYGCPAILSKNLAEQTSDYITTFINDSDIVPRLSGLSLTNLLYDIIEFDWLPYAEKDVQNVFKDLQEFQPHLFNSDTVTTMKNIITPILESIHHDTYIPTGTIPRLDVELYPPGKCIHIYSTDRVGQNEQRPQELSHRSACYVPNWFYNQIDVNKHMIDGTSSFIVTQCDSHFLSSRISNISSTSGSQIICYPLDIFRQLLLFKVPRNERFLVKFFHNC
jgi:hypothetical protein